MIQNAQFACEVNKMEDFFKISQNDNSQISLKDTVPKTIKETKKRKAN